MIPPVRLLSWTHEGGPDLTPSILKSGAIPITTPRFRSKVAELLSSQEYSNNDAEVHSLKLPAFSTQDVFLTPDMGPSVPLVVASFWIDIGSPNVQFSKLSELVLLQELSFASFCGVQNVLVRGPSMEPQGEWSSRLACISKLIANVLEHHGSLVVSLMIDATPANTGTEARTLLSSHEAIGDVSKGRVDDWQTWSAWDTVRSLCHYSDRLTLALTIGKTLPSLAIQARWSCEPIRYLILGEGAFEEDVSHQPSLDSIQERFVAELTRRRIGPDIVVLPQAIVASLSDEYRADGTAALPSESSTALLLNREPTEYLVYFSRLQSRQEPRTAIENYAVGNEYDDTLHQTSRPATEILKNSTYSFFEGDTVKYDWYETALRRALKDWKSQGKPTSGPHGAILLAVLGPGRGPLVTRALRASRAENVAINVWAVERNPNAIYVLRSHNEHEWGHEVNIVHSDVRHWDGPFTGILGDGSQGCPAPIDIIVSEMLGDFGDNELAPECLDGALHLLAPWGISIPSSFETFVTPVSTPTLHSKLREMATSDCKVFHTPYWTWLQWVDYVSVGPRLNGATSLKTCRKALVDGEQQKIPRLQAVEPSILPVWQFTHSPSPRPSAALRNAQNTRRAEVTFDTENGGVCHGLAGYFECVLYPGVELSTNPNTNGSKCPNLTSWLTMFFPLKVEYIAPCNFRQPMTFIQAPFYVQKGSKLNVVMERKTDGRQVWYEWMLESMRSRDIGGAQTWSEKIGATERHSSYEVSYVLMGE